jgi:hypothetical protein
LLLPLLEKRGLGLIAQEAGNCNLPAHPGEGHSCPKEDLKRSEKISAAGENEGEIET